MNNNNDMDNILDKIEQIKTDLNNLQQKLEAKELQADDEHNLVTTIVNGKGKILDFNFTKNIDIETKNALIESVNKALEKADKIERESKQQIVGDIDVPDVPGIF